MEDESNVINCVSLCCFVYKLCVRIQVYDKRLYHYWDDFSQSKILLSNQKLYSSLMTVIYIITENSSRKNNEKSYLTSFFLC